MRAPFYGLASLTRIMDLIPERHEPYPAFAGARRYAGLAVHAQNPPA
ncbi:MAG: hypothetical protein AB1768_05350 [Pseudomonadota bacterium]|jgi:hypothetical protein